jgi:sulfotransferase family protein
MTQLQQADTLRSARATVRHEPVFVLAPARSCSTVTVALLAGHPGIYGFPEMLLFTAGTVGELLQKAPKPMQPPAFVEDQRSGILRAVADLLVGSQEEPAILRAEQWLAGRSSWSPGRLMDHLLELVYPQVGLEKSPETVLTTKALNACMDSYPNARYIHLTRHPVTTMRSTIDHLRPWVNQSEKALVVGAASSWYLGHLRIVRKLAQLPARQWTRIRAEDLLREPAAQLPRLISWLGLPADDALIAQMMHTENWRFAGTGPSGGLLGGDPKFMMSPALRPIPEPGEIAFDESWGLLPEMRDRMIILASALGY